MEVIGILIGNKVSDCRASVPHIHSNIYMSFNMCPIQKTIREKMEKIVFKKKQLLQKPIRENGKILFRKRENNYY